MRILFQGDSITDAGRNRDNPHHLGGGYPKFAAELLQRRYPDRAFEFLNFGISGNRTWDLLARWDSDCLAHDPDVVSILIGINDTWRRYDQNLPTTVEQFEQNYRSLLEQVKARTHARILMLEPFLLHVDESKRHWREDLDPKIQVVQALAREYADDYIPLDGYFASITSIRPPATFTEDGVHPNEAGAKFIAALYANAIEQWLM